MNSIARRDSVPYFPGRTACAVFAALVLGFIAVSGASADPRMPGDALVEAVRSSYSRAGRVQPFTSFPVSEDEIRRAVEELGRDPASEPSAVAALEGMIPLRDRLDAGLELSYVRYLRTSEEYVEDYANKNAIDLQRLYLSEPAFLRWRLGWEGGDGLYVRAEQVLRRQLDASDFFKDDNFWEIGQAGNPVAMENNNFARGVVGWSRNGYRVTFGRDKAHIGPETFSSLFVSDRIPYLDSLRASVPIGPLRMDWYAATIRAVEVVNTSLDPVPPYGYFRSDNQTAILNVLNRVEWRGDRLRLAFTQDQMLVRPNNYFELSDFFPVLFWHSTYPKPYNGRLVADASWCFRPGWTATAQVGFDDFNAGAIGVGDTDIPTIDAYILSLRWDGGGAERRTAVALEGGYTHYLWGCFDEIAVGHTEDSSGTLSRAVYRMRLDGGGQGIPLTSPYGPGALWLRAGLELPDLGPGMSLEAGALFLSKNTAADLLNTVYEASDAIKNAPRTSYFELSASAKYSWKSFAFTFAPLLAARDRELWAELALGVSWAFELRKEYRGE